MSEKANYFKIGLFFVMSVILIVTAVIVWGAGFFTKDKIYFETYFDSAVTGLNVGASVELMGVKIGQVESIGFASTIYDISTGPETVSRYERYVRVLCSISAEESKERVGDVTDEQREARMRNLTQQGGRLRLASNILTGQAYLEGTFLDPERFPVLDIKWKPKHMYVPSAPGAFSTMQNSVDEILNKLENLKFEAVVENLNKILLTANQAIEDANLKTLSSEITQLVSHADQAVSDANIKALSTKANALIEELRQSNLDLKKLIENPNPQKELDNIPALVDKFNQVLSQVDLLTTSETPEVREIIQNIRQLSENLNYLAEHLKDNPSGLLFSAPPSKQEK